MFLHSGASLHGHEFSPKGPQVVHQTYRQNSLLCSGRPLPVNRSLTFPIESPPHPDLKNVAEGKEPGFGIESMVGGSEDVSEVEECEVEPVALQEEMSEDAASSITGIETGTIRPLAQTRTAKGHRTRTNYIIAHPPPKLRTKQRIIHIRPKLVLQMQQVSVGERPQPVIDVYPSSAVAGSIIAPLLKRFPRIAPLKNELSIHDVMLVRSEDYTSRVSGYEGDDDEENLMSRELLAILSPSNEEDKTEIVMAEGTAWVATTRAGKGACSYEFTTVDSMGTTTTARWVRKRVVASSLPGTPTSPTSDTLRTTASDCTFTFSFIDPKTRRHPIIATLTSTSLSVSDTYTAVSPFPDQDPPGSSSSSRANSPCRGEENKPGKSTQPVEEWQRAFISVSAIWVALRHGWAPTFRPEDMIPSHASAVSPTAERGVSGRKRSQSATVRSSPMTPTSPSFDTSGRRKPPPLIGLRQNEMHSANTAPRRATSTGASFMRKRMAAQAESDKQAPDDFQISNLNRRAFSGDWSVGLAKGGHENSLAETMMDSLDVSSEDNSEGGQSPALASAATSTRRRVVSEICAVNHLSPDLAGNGTAQRGAALAEEARFPRQVDGSEPSTKRRSRKWRSMVTWFRKLSKR
ncbi:hypothetical protein GGS20DRAFT_533371 [Poronia punctata]|nr:hypothetical protein GGS20DRAFT_533371 [Poronia punctata]